MKTSSIALTFSLLLATGMCNYVVQDWPNGKQVGVRPKNKMDKRNNQFLWNPDNTAYCTDHSMCDDWCTVFPPDECILAGTHAFGCTQNNLCSCYSTEPKRACECAYKRPMVDACLRGSSPLDVPNTSTAHCVWGCEIGGHDNGGNGACNAAQDPCKAA
ncbi:unnamed protein product [Zymoseptoria tritici ST99CH_1A5]|uniref:Secreted protein n=3 Tax=Zymoseptoria tritici TaxID=1047171 RepID=A0A1X7RIR1_ZYMT9|nr:unnamed protein product [Zymoseptoria tritici ST99CH_3D7]SMR45837.1 unnamed protein product [Zymoseptoria tritici ST99CH_1E4]SMR47087.1 unnamed protein product [Zymoseptoria tritici ST99CH_3D1]SMY20989.1 unnamed protein product [Zymoseptoria tritici ST99CH_1A5]